MLKNMRLRSKLFLVGILLTMLPLIVILSVVFRQNGQVVQTAEKKTLDLSCATLERAVMDLEVLAASHQEVTQKNVLSALRVAHALMQQSGPVHFTDETVAWQAINPLDSSVREVQLPKMYVGNQWLGQTVDSGTPVAIVDAVREQMGVTCTIFQRMNEAGDMLRLATNVIDANDSSLLSLVSASLMPLTLSNNPIFVPP